MTEKLAKPRPGGPSRTTSLSEHDNRVAGATPRSSVSWVTSFTINILMVAVGIGLSNYLLPQGHRRSPRKTASSPAVNDEDLLGPEGALLFKSLDSDKNGALNSQEFGPIVEKLTGDVCFGSIV